MKRRRGRVKVNALEKWGWSRGWAVVRAMAVLRIRREPMGYDGLGKRGMMVLLGMKRWVELSVRRVLLMMLLLLRSAETLLRRN